MEVSTKSSHQIATHRKSQGLATKAIFGIHSAHHRSGLQQQILRSYSCCPSKTKRSRTSFTTPLPSSKRRRLPLAPLVRRGSSIPTSARGKAVLPKRRKRALVSEDFPKRFSHSVAMHDRVELVTRRGTRLSVRNLHNSTCESHSNPLDGEPTTCISPTEGIDSATIFRQLNVLKRGGYWKHLPRDEVNMVEQERPPRERLPREMYDSIRKEENKENSPTANHPNMPVSSSSQIGWDGEEEEEEEDDEYFGEDVDGRGTFVENLYIGSAFVTGHSRNMLGEFVGFRVHSITDDGWLCGSERSRDISIQNHQLQPLLLLHLPRKVAALGRPGMRVWGVDLMKRWDNGALEPHSHHVCNTSHGNRDGSLGDSVFGRIFL